MIPRTVMRVPPQHSTIGGIDQSVSSAFRQYPLCPPRMHREVGHADRRAPGFCYKVVVLYGAAADADRPDQNPLRVHNRQPTRKGDEPLITMLDPIERAAGLRQLADLSRRHRKEAGGFRLLEGDVDASDPCIVHSDERL